MRRVPGWMAPLLALLLVGLLVAGVAAATRQKSVEERPAGAANTEPDASASGEADAFSRDAPTDDLADTLLTPPPEFVRLADENVGTGPLDADRAPALDGFGGLSPAELTQLGLVAGHSRAWQSDVGVLLAIAYEFGDEDGAVEFVEQAAAAREADARYERTPLDEVPEAVLLRSTGEGDDTIVLLLPQGRRAYVLGLSRTSAEGGGGLASDLATRQRDAASGSEGPGRAGG